MATVKIPTPLRRLTGEKDEIKTHDIEKTITLEDLTNPNQK